MCALHLSPACRHYGRQARCRGQEERVHGQWHGPRLPSDSLTTVSTDHTSGVRVCARIPTSLLTAKRQAELLAFVKSAAKLWHSIILAVQAAAWLLVGCNGAANAV